MLLRQIMNRDVTFVRPEDDLFQVAEKMKAEETGALPVCDGDRLRGLITDRDIVIRALAERKDFGGLKVSDVMSKRVHYLFEDESVHEAAKLMQDKQVRRVLILDRAKRLVGVVSLGDLSLGASEKELGRTLKAVARPNTPQGYYKELKKGPRAWGPSSYLVVLGGVGGIGALTYYLSKQRDFQGFVDKLNDFIAKIQKKVA